ncbi:unnamed protein product [Trichobilharzia regenti]|nr:unnamed protein product [Trichobilharzia regenti]
MQWVGVNLSSWRINLQIQLYEMFLPNTCYRYLVVLDQKSPRSCRIIQLRLGKHPIQVFVLIGFESVKNLGTSDGRV